MMRRRSLLWLAVGLGLLLPAGWLVASRHRPGEPPRQELSWDDLMSAKPAATAEQPAMAFAPAVTALNGKLVTLHGWITPINLGDGTTVSTFLLTGTPGTCPFCFGAGPQDFVLVSAAQPVPADPTVELALAGTFAVAADDPSGFYYRLRGAVQVK